MAVQVAACLKLARGVGTLTCKGSAHSSRERRTARIATTALSRGLSAEGRTAPPPVPPVLLAGAALGLGALVITREMPLTMRSNKLAACRSQS